MAIHEQYEPSVVEQKWQKRWAEQHVFRMARHAQRKKKYVLEMLPYPSGHLHMGHVRVYAIGDVYARYYLMQGMDVVHPMGFDAFGLPAENAAIKDGVHPATRTAENVATFRQEMMAMGYAYDWQLELNTSQAEYYRWNQWFFLQMRKKGLVYRRTAKLNWCTGCLTVIANEQVVEGHCERCDSVVVDKEMREWAFRITRYSQELLDALEGLSAWPERIVAAQRNWIGRSEGAWVDFAVEGTPHNIRVFTTRLDTICGCTYVVLAPEHPLTQSLITAAQAEKVRQFVEKISKQSKVERTDETAAKEGVFTGAYAQNPFTRERVPIWLANFVLADYGTGAVMSVPAHDVRDFAFAKQYGLPLRTVIQPATDKALEEPLETAFVEDGVLANSGSADGWTSPEARRRWGEWLKEQKLGEPTVTYRQRDWGFSRQRYWGTPIPVVYCKACDPTEEGIDLEASQLPLLLPPIDTQAVIQGHGEPPLAKVPSFVNTTCPKCGGPARREVDTMDTFVDSSWYYARYLSPGFEGGPFELAKAQHYLPIDIYVGGPEHATMHLLYFRFWCRIMKLLGLVEVEEPAKRLITQGIVNGSDGRKMSKRWGNFVPPLEIIGKYGADSLRLFVLFAAPPERDMNWNNEQIEGTYRFAKRIWALAALHVEKVKGAQWTGPFSGTALEVVRATHKCIKRVTQAIERLSFNTAIAGAMEFLNTLYAAPAPHTEEEKAAMRFAFKSLALVLTPFAPHLCDEIWEALGEEGCTVEAAWPSFDEALVVDALITYVVQVNGKLRAELHLPVEATEEAVCEAARAEPKVAALLQGKTVKKCIFVPKRLVNFVVV
ncbi:MAG: leucine--tRNA ligase [Cystobacterineae bacterium]|nr:leucine--tRNA ligase [Cystobacterineae bacterium]